MTLELFAHGICIAAVAISAVPVAWLIWADTVGNQSPEKPRPELSYPQFTPVNYR